MTQYRVLAASYRRIAASHPHAVVGVLTNNHPVSGWLAARTPSNVIFL
jgi:hypothetical protein